MPNNRPMMNKAKTLHNERFIKQRNLFRGVEMNPLIDSKFSGDYGRNPETGEHFLEERINHRAREKGQWKHEEYTYDYDLFDRERYIAACLEAGRLFVITWEPSTVRLRCRHYSDVFGVPDLFGIEEIPTLFSDKKGMESHRIFLIPYLITGYDIPLELEQDPEPLVPFIAKTIEMMKEIESEGVATNGKDNCPS